MKRSLYVLVFLAMAGTAMAGTITSISPQWVKVNGGEQFVDIYGSGLGSVAVFDGPAGHFEVNTNANFTTFVVSWVPDAVMRTAGYYSLYVRGGTGDSNSVTFEVRGLKFFPFVIIAPDVLRIQPINREGAYVKYDVFWAGGETQDGRVECFPASGDFFKMGITRVSCTGSNGAGEKAEANFNVIVRDEEAPKVFVPREPIVVKWESREGAVVRFDASAYDDIYGDVKPECLPASGSVFPVGVTKVQCAATDFDGNTGFGFFDVEVIGDVKWYPLKVNVPDLVVVDARSPEGEYVEFKAWVEGGEDPNPELTCDWKPGSFFPLGSTTVTCDAIDRYGMRGSASFGVEVRDPEAPVIEKLYATPDRINSDGRMYPIEVVAGASDNFDQRPLCTIFAVTSNQDISTGDGQDPEKYGDWKITGDLTIELRGEATRLDRYYDVWVGCTDYYGNRTNSTARVVVPAGSGNSAPSEPATPKRRSGPKG